MHRTLIACLAAALFSTAPQGSAQTQPPSTAPSKSAPLQVALTFDDLPAHGQLPPGETRFDVAKSILDTLKREKMPPVYGFVNGIGVAEAPATIDVLRLWHAAGEPLGSHTFSHIDLETNSAEDFEADIAKNEPILHEIAGSQDWHWLRYPYLHEGETLAKREEVRRYLTANGYKIAEVSLDFEDYLWNNPYARCSAKKDEASIAELEKSYLGMADAYITVFRELTHRLYGRDIPYVLLLHIGAFDAKMLPQLIGLLRQRGFTFTTLPETQKDPIYAIDPAVGYKGGGALQEFAAVAREMKYTGDAKPYKQLDTMCR